MKKLVLYSSLILNIILFALLLHSWAMPRKAKENYGETAMKYLQSRISVKEGDIVIAGGELLFYANWAELFSDSRIRNKSGEPFTKTEAFELLQDLKGSNPAKIIIQIGIDDIKKGTSAKDFSSDLRDVIDETRRQLPQTEILLLSLTPVNPSISILPHANLSNDKIIEYNNAIRTIATENQVIMINIYDSLTDETTGYLQRGYCMTDGYHLNSGAYYIIKDRLKDFIK